MKFMPPKPRKALTARCYEPWVEVIPKMDFDEWYDDVIKPLFESAVEVNCKAGTFVGWYASEDKDASMVNTTHKAILINFKPTKEESAEDILREWIKESNGDCWQGNWEPRTKTIYKKAKAYLERKK